MLYDREKHSLLVIDEPMRNLKIILNKDKLIQQVKQRSCFCRVETPERERTHNYDLHVTRGSFKSRSIQETI